MSLDISLGARPGSAGATAQILDHDDVSAPLSSSRCLALPADDDELAAAAVRIHALIQRSVENIVEAGRELIAVKSRLSHGRFESWTEREFGMSPRTARRWMQIATWVEGKTATVTDLELRTLYQLSAPSNVKASSQIAERLQHGERLCDDDICEIIKEAKVAAAVERQDAKLTPRSRRRKLRQREADQVRQEDARQQLDERRHQADDAVAEIVTMLRAHLPVAVRERFVALADIATLGFAGGSLSDIAERVAEGT